MNNYKNVEIIAWDVKMDDELERDSNRLEIFLNDWLITTNLEHDVTFYQGMPNYSDIRKYAIRKVKQELLDEIIPAEKEIRELMKINPRFQYTKDTAVYKYYDSSKTKMFHRLAPLSYVPVGKKLIDPKLHDILDLASKVRKGERNETFVMGATLKDTADRAIKIYNLDWNNFFAIFENG